MNKRLTAFLITLSLTLTFLPIYPVYAAEPIAKLEISVTDKTTGQAVNTINIGEVFRATVSMTDFPNLSIASPSLHFNPDVVKVCDADGNILTSGINQQFFEKGSAFSPANWGCEIPAELQNYPYLNNETGVIGMYLDSRSSKSLTGTQTMYSVYFKAIAEGNADIRLTDINDGNGKPNPLDYYDSAVFLGRKANYAIYNMNTTSLAYDSTVNFAAPPLSVTTEEPVIYVKMTQDDTGLSWGYVEKTFTAEFYAKNFDNIKHVVLPLFYDKSKAVLLDKSGETVNGTTNKMNVLSINETDFNLTSNAKYPEFDAGNGYCQIWLEAKAGTVRPNGESLKLFSMKFKATDIGSFAFKYAKNGDVKFDSASPVGGTVLIEGLPNSGSATDLVILPALNQTYIIYKDASQPPQEVIVDKNTDGTTATVIVTGATPGAEIRLYNNENGNVIAGPAIANDEGYVVFLNVPLSGTTDDKVYASAKEPNKDESDRIFGQPEEFDTERVIAVVKNPSVKTVPNGTEQSSITFPDKIEGQIGIVVKDKSTGDELGLYLLPATEYFDLAGDWVCGNYSPATAATYNFAGVPMRAGVANKYALTAVQQIVVLPADIGTNDFAVVFLNGSEIYGAVQTIASGGKATRPATDPTQPNGTFDGWYSTNAQGVLEEFDFDAPITGVTVIQAMFTYSYTITFESGANGTGTMASQSIGRGATYDIPECAFTPNDGYVFTGWSDGANTYPASGGKIENVSSNITLTAQYRTKDPDAKHTVSGRLTGGSPSNKTVSYTVNGVAGSVVTDSNGLYLVADVPDGAKVVITPPAQTSYIVSPTSKTLDSVIEDTPNQDFTYTYSGGSSGGGGGGVSTATLIINCVNEDGTVIYTQTITTVVVGKTQTINAPDLEGYTLNDTAPKTVTIKSGTNTAEFKYAKKDAQLNKADHYRYVLGYPDGSIKPEGNITREEVAAIFYRLLTPESRKQYRKITTTFLDIDPHRWSVMEIGTMQNASIIQGRDTGDFDPDANITRAEFAAIAMRFDKLQSGVPHSFTDIAGHWAEDYIASAAAKGWIMGYPDNSFKPNQPITRAEAMTLINRVLERKVDKDGLLHRIAVLWPDLPQGHWAYYEVMEATISHEYVRRSENDIVEDWTDSGEDINFDADDGVVQARPVAPIILQPEVMPGTTPEPQVEAGSESLKESKYITHIVVSSDTLWGLAEKYGTTVNEIKSLNGLQSDTIQPGQKLKVSGK